jgi:hypothetical protein
MACTTSIALRTPFSHASVKKHEKKTKQVMDEPVQSTIAVGPGVVLETPGDNKL